MSSVVDVQTFKQQSTSKIKGIDKPSTSKMKSSENLSKHNITLKEQGKLDEVYFSCAVCRRTFDVEERLIEHEEEEHENVRPHICKICRKRCYSRLNLKKHEKVHAKQWFLR